MDADTDGLTENTEIIEEERAGLEQKFRAYLISYFGITGTAIDQFREKMLTTDDEDEIQTVQAATDNGKLYDLQGRRIANPSKSGIYIMNGKKVLIPFRTNR